MSPPPPPPKNKGGNSVLQRICRNSHRFNIEIQILVGLVMPLYGSQHNNRFRICYALLTLN
ncbi:hypothetical protein B1J93_06400 [Leptospira kirschneri serovar Pomona]|uniref:Uncharacterized protein n=1 Tax=Leptospira kirschneri serovar Pomona TaxID=561005 RepID=A0A1T1DTA4_9LEPT|nr:hypothetical protein B1J93_06400 [Leptospira kirschneri serovar Pomona]